MAEIASAFVSLLPSAKGFGRKMESQVGGEVDGAGKRLGSGFGKAFAIAGGALAAAGIGSFLKGSVDAASDLSESASKVGVVFGDSADQIMRTAKTSATAMGLSKAAYLGATGSLGNLLVSLDLAPKKAANMSQEMVKLAGDLASFNNVSPEEALAALQSGLTGETEPLKKFGVNMNDATLKAQALKDGLITSTKEALTPQAKALAAQALIMKQTGTAQGDFARTSGGLANQQRILSAQFDDVKAKVGTALLPVVTKFVSFLNAKMTPALSAIGDAIGRAKAFVAPFVSAAKGVIDILFRGDFTGGIFGLYEDAPEIGVLFRIRDTAVTAFGQVKAAIGPLVAAVRANFLPVLQTMATTFKTVVLPAVLAVVSYVSASLVPIFKQVAQIVVSQVLPVVGKLAQFFYGTLYPAVIKIVTAVAKNLKPIFDQLVTTVRGSVLPTVAKLLTKFEEYRPTIQKVILQVVKVVGAVLTFAAAIAAKVLPVAIRFAGFLISNVVPAVASVIGVVIKIISKVLDFGGALVDGVKKVGRFASGVGEKIGAALQYVKDLPAKVLGILGVLADKMYNAGVQLVGQLATGIRDKIDDAVNAMKAGVDRLKGLLPGSPIKWGPLKNWNNGGAGQRLMDLVTLGITKATPRTVAAAKSAFEKIGDALREQRDNLRSTLDGLKSDFASLSESVSSAFLGDLFNPPEGTSFIDNLLGKKSQLTGLLASFTTLKGWGLDPAFLSQLFASGNGALITELAGMGQSGAMGAASLFGEVQSLGAQLGTAVASNDPVASRIDETNKKLDEVNRQLSFLGSDIGAALNGAAAKARRDQKGKGKK